MKLTSYKSQGLASYGLWQDAAIVDLPALYAMQGRAAAPASVLDLIERGQAALEEVRNAITAAAGTFGAAHRDPAALELLPPVTRPPKVFCIGRNYAEHAKEAGFEMSPIPIMFNRYTATLIGHGAQVLFPKVSEQLDWEGELAVVIGKGHRGQIAREAAMDHVFGYTAFNDITVRDYQFRTTQYLAGKNFRTSGPLGPVLVTKDALPDPHGVQIRTRERGRDAERQHLDHAFRHPFIINHLSEFIDLEAGDVIAMGTPAGVGFKRKPPLFLKPGDVVEVEVEGIGILSNPVVADA
ncbi:fumarylacetoacetate hydrolase family protein [Tabrizicola soli]|uniref:fumarylacetoacetate hydrolase family protein n=1 Tax=Tabrizicola soli TaxID=2185115 RepID=UPI00362E60AB